MHVDNYLAWCQVLIFRICCSQVPYRKLFRKTSQNTVLIFTVNLAEDRTALRNLTRQPDIVSYVIRSNSSTLKSARSFAEYQSYKVASYPAGIYLFKVSDKTCGNVVVVSLPSTMNRFHLIINIIARSFNILRFQ